MTKSPLTDTKWTALLLSESCKISVSSSWHWSAAWHDPLWFIWETDLFMTGLWILSGVDPRDAAPCSKYPPRADALQRSDVSISYARSALRCSYASIIEDLVEWIYPWQGAGGTRERIWGIRKTWWSFIGTRSISSYKVSLNIFWVNYTTAIRIMWIQYIIVPTS